MIFSIEGIMGCGKTTFITRLAESLVTKGYKVILYPEFVPSTLQNYLRNPRRYTFQFQKEILLNRIKIIDDAKKYSETGYIVLLDRSTYGDMAFIRHHVKKGNLSEKQGNKLLDKMPHTPGIIYYIDINYDEVLRRIANRKRPGECDVYTEEYLARFSLFYKNQLDNYVSKYFSGNVEEVDIEDLLMENTSNFCAD
jgi:deoxyadenosine/deoxycytidine kinase